MAVFVDASAWVALVNARDGHHGAATGHFRQLGVRTLFVTSNYVLAEAYTWLKSRRLHQASLRLNEMIVSAEQLRQLQLAWVTREVHDDAWRIFADYDDQDFSFFDCTSFVICRQDAVEHVFTFDSDFRTMGFEVRP